MAILTKLGNYKSTGLLIIRAGVGFFMILHGYPKLAGGPEKWTKLGASMANLGITAYPEIWGFLAAASEGVGGLLLLLGFFFRPSAFLLLCTMLVAGIKHMSGAQNMLEGLNDASHALELAFVFLGLFILGPGRYSLDKS